MSDGIIDISGRAASRPNQQYATKADVSKLIEEALPVVVRDVLNELGTLTEGALRRIVRDEMRLAMFAQPVIEGLADEQIEAQRLAHDGEDDSA